MTHYHVVGMDNLPEPIRAMLMGSSDPEKLRMRHEIQARDKASFWDSLSKDQLVHLTGMMMEIGKSDDETSRMLAGRYLGLAEGRLMMKYNSCGCGTEHRDPSEFIQQLAQEANAEAIDQQDAEKLGLYKIREAPFVDPRHVGKWACSKCSTVYDTITDRIEDSIEGGGHEDCTPHDSSPE
ncbi:hypothetical protein AB0F25_30665 [Streptomyces wedmorensis]|uniref:hypothetical protein n=1 Tax=Streptomyces wedmorensis TaxID=43759 RepID=UPI003437A350